MGRLSGGGARWAAAILRICNHADCGEEKLNQLRRKRQRACQNHIPFLFFAHCKAWCKQEYNFTAFTEIICKYGNAVCFHYGDTGEGEHAECSALPYRSEVIKSCGIGVEIATQLQYCLICLISNVALLVFLAGTSQIEWKHCFAE
jgi:hypothetical protein